MDSIIREYILTAKPVSSQTLEEKRDFGICPASIRIEMQKLTDSGFLAQPHTSAGRVPTDMGYRFFVDNLLEPNSGLARGIDFEADFDIHAEFEDFFRGMQELSKSIAAASDSLVLGYLSNEDVFFKVGWEQVLRQPEFSQKGLIDNFLDYLRYLEANIEEIKPDSDFELFIGRENPCPSASNFATLSVLIEPSNDKEVLLSIVGPKRMAYDRNIALTNEIIKIFENL